MIKEDDDGSGVPVVLMVLMMMMKAAFARQALSAQQHQRLTVLYSPRSLMVGWFRFDENGGCSRLYQANTFQHTAMAAAH